MVAIIIPFYKLTFFDQVLKSLSVQTDKRFTVYIGDDCSPEDPLEVINKYKDDIEIVYHRFEKNLGGEDLVKQWQRCVSLSKDEEWIMLLGDDDILGENVIKEFYKYININKNVEIDLIRFKLQIIDALELIQENRFEYDEIENSERLLQRMFSKEETITASEFIFSRDVYEINHGFINFPLAWFSDYATWLQFGLKSKIHNINTSCVYWRLSGINISSQFKSFKQIKLKVRSLFLFMNYIDDNFNVKNNIKNKYIFEHLNYLLIKMKYVDILYLLTPEIIKFRFKYFPIIFKYIYILSKKNSLKKFS